MSKRTNSKKVTSSHKVTIGALSLLSMVGGWNLIGRMEQAAAQETAPTAESLGAAPVAAVAESEPAVTATPWPTIPALAINGRLPLRPVPTLAPSAQTGADLAPQAAADGENSFALSALPSLAPLPTLAPLPAAPQYVPPPPPPPRPSGGGGGGGGGGGNTSGGS